MQGPGAQPSPVIVAGNAASRGMVVRYSVEEEPLGTGGGPLKLALGRFEDDEFHALNGDVPTNLSLDSPRELARERFVGGMGSVPLRSPYRGFHSTSIPGSADSRRSQ